jgi:hypothetical protein
LSFRVFTPSEVSLVSMMNTGIAPPSVLGRLESVVGRPEPIS